MHGGGIFLLYFLICCLFSSLLERIREVLIVYFNFLREGLGGRHMARDGYGYSLFA